MNSFQSKSTEYKKLITHYEGVLNTLQKNLYEAHLFSLLQVAGVMVIVQVIKQQLDFSLVESTILDRFILFSAIAALIGMMTWTHFRMSKHVFNPNAMFAIVDLKDQLESGVGQRLARKIENMQYIYSEDIREFVLAEKRALGININKKLSKIVAD